MPSSHSVLQAVTSSAELFSLMLCTTSRPSSARWVAIISFRELPAAFILCDANVMGPASASESKAIETTASIRVMPFCSDGAETTDEEEDGRHFILSEKKDMWVVSNIKLRRIYINGRLNVKFCHRACVRRCSTADDHRHDRLIERRCGTENIELEG